MKDPTNESKGFGGLSGLSGRRPASSSSQAESQQPEAEVPIASVESVAPPPQTRTAAPKWRGVVIASVLGLSGLGLIVAIAQDPGNGGNDGAAIAAGAGDDAAVAAALAAASATDDAGRWGGDASTADAAQAAADAAAAAADAAASSADAVAPPSFSERFASGNEDEHRPGIGTDQVLYGPQIRYCVHEKIRLDAAESAVDSYDGNAVDRFNGMVSDYNGRCGSFRYRAGALEAIQSEAESMRHRLEAEGRSRFPHVTQMAEPVVEQSLSDVASYNDVSSLDADSQEEFELEDEVSDE
jgi:hypothetical protein